MTETQFMAFTLIFFMLRNVLIATGYNEKDEVIKTYDTNYNTIANILSYGEE